MSNSNYQLEGSFNMFSGKVTSGKFKLDTKAGDPEPGVFTGVNFKIKPLLTATHSLSSFSFSITDELIDFGLLSATNPVTRTSDLSILSPGSGYQVLAYEDHPLRSKEGATIPDTTCDNGSCNESMSALWDSALTYGFGYRCDNIKGNDCEGQFRTANYFKQFADNSQNEPWEMIAGSRSPSNNSEARITYKVNIAGAQRTGSYSNNIVFIATPGY